VRASVRGTFEQLTPAHTTDEMKDDMTTVLRRALMLAIALMLPIAPALGATPTPTPVSHKPIAVPTPHYPNTKLHTEFVVEVNAKGQVVRVKSGKSCNNPTFNAQTYGNVLQMWIRHPDGTADVGLYKVTYDYDPKTTDVHRGISIVSRGGDWGDKEGAADSMIDIANKEAKAQQQAQQQKAEQVRKNLPPLNNIINVTPTPSPHP
jgi:hypothetical protein